MKESLSSTFLCFIIQGKGSSWKRFEPEVYFVDILLQFDTIEFLLFTHVMKYEGVFVSNTNFFAGKGGLYEFIMFYNMRA